MTMKKEKTDFRVCEYDGVFEIQRKSIKQENIGKWWEKKEIKKTTSWGVVDKLGNRCYSISTPYYSYSNYDEKIETFPNVQDAIDKIDLMVKGIKYHY